MTKCYTKTWQPHCSRNWKFTWITWAIVYCFYNENGYVLIPPNLQRIDLIKSPHVQHVHDSRNQPTFVVTDTSWHVFCNTQAVLAHIHTVGIICFQDEVVSHTYFCWLLFSYPHKFDLAWECLCRYCIHNSQTQICWRLACNVRWVIHRVMHIIVSRWAGYIFCFSVSIAYLIYILPIILFRGFILKFLFTLLASIAPPHLSLIHVLVSPCPDPRLVAKVLFYLSFVVSLKLYPVPTLGIISCISIIMMWVLWQTLAMSLMVRILYHTHFSALFNHKALFLVGMLSKLLDPQEGGTEVIIWANSGRYLQYYINRILSSWSAYRRDYIQWCIRLVCLVPKHHCVNLKIPDNTYFEANEDISFSKFWD